MDNDLIEEELTQVTRRGLLLKGGAAAAGLSVLGVPSRAFAASEATNLPLITSSRWIG